MNINHSLYFGTYRSFPKIEERLDISTVWIHSIPKYKDCLDMVWMYQRSFYFGKEWHKIPLCPYVILSLPIGTSSMLIFNKNVLIFMHMIPVYFEYYTTVRRSRVLYQREFCVPFCWCWVGVAVAAGRFWCGQGVLACLEATGGIFDVITAVLRFLQLRSKSTRMAWTYTRRQYGSIHHKSKGFFAVYLFTLLFFLAVVVQ